MKSKQCLDVQQMQHLKELGLELKDTMLYWIKPLDAVIGIVVGLENDWQLDFIDDKKKKYLKYIPAYTLQDVLDALPVSIGDDEGDVYWLQIEKMDMKNDDWRVSYLFFSQHKYFHCFQSQHLIDAAYEMLCWAIENKFVETNKNK